MRMNTDDTRKIMDSTKKTLLKEDLESGGDYEPEEAVETYINGNISDFKEYLKRCTKYDLLQCVVILRDQYNVKNAAEKLMRFVG